ncbi:MAG TPA: circadian clock KaiB family protein, partial [Polyangiaceae bacterium]|nr:circadian clock KaiB family protein [Polyangiaceae bacterium]
MIQFKLRLYITGRTGQSQRALANLRAICDSALPDAYEVEVIDVLENPALAESEKILATPTLVKWL